MDTKFLDRVSLENEIARLNGLLASTSHQYFGQCRHCGSTIPVHAISKYFVEKMQDSEYLTIPISIIPSFVIDVAAHNANRIRQENGMKLISAGFESRGPYSAKSTTHYAIEGSNYPYNK